MAFLRLDRGIIRATVSTTCFVSGGPDTVQPVRLKPTAPSGVTERSKSGLSNAKQPDRRKSALFRVHLRPNSGLRRRVQTMATRRRRERAPLVPPALEAAGRSA
jgi:hypothetical protein